MTLVLPLYYLHNLVEFAALNKPHHHPAIIAFLLTCKLWDTWLLVYIYHRVYRKRCHGRLKKQLGDLCLLGGVANESMLHYQTSIELLKSTNDYLWLAGKLILVMDIFYGHLVGALFAQTVSFLRLAENCTFFTRETCSDVKCTYIIPPEGWNFECQDP